MDSEWFGMVHVCTMPFRGVPKIRRGRKVERERERGPRVKPYLNLIEQEEGRKAEG